MSNKGLLLAAALILAALYVLTDEEKPFTVTFTLDALPQVLRKRIEPFSEGLLITATRISKGGNYSPLTNKQFEGIVVNRLRDTFGLRDDWSKQ